MVSKARKTAAQASSNIAGRKNLLFNGSMATTQRATSSSGLGTTSGYYVQDRWRIQLGGSNTVRFTMSLEGASESPDGFQASMKLDCTTADTMPGDSTSDYVIVEQKLEGLDLQPLKKGTSDAEPLTASFWIKSPKTGIHTVSLYDTTNTRSISTTYTIASADTWEFHTVTFAGDTTGTIPNDNTEGLTLWFWLMASSNYTSGTFNTSWASHVAANACNSSQVNVFDDTSNNFYITGCQLEIGNSPTSFEFETLQENLFRCQRYHYRINAMTAYLYSLIDSSGGSVYNRITFTHPPMRSNAPTGSISNTISSAASQGFQYAQEKTSTVYGNPSSGGTLTLLSSATITLTDEL